MSHRITYSVIRGVEPSRAKHVLAEAAKSLPGSSPQNSKWSDFPYVVASKKIVALAVPDALVLTSDAWPLAQEVARLVDEPHLELRIQEGDHWDFTLFHRTQVIADFSTRVSYFNSDSAVSRPWKQGSAETFASAWNVPLARVAPYLSDWDSLTAPAFAAEGDSYPSGEYWQILDFMRAMGVDDPGNHPQHFECDMPTWQVTFSPQPRWRRAVRRISVWIKGTYPDVPRRTRAQADHWQRRRSSVTITKIDLGSPAEDE